VTLLFFAYGSMERFFVGLLVSLTVYYSVCRPHCPCTINRVKTHDGATLHLHHWLTSLVLLFYIQNAFVRGLLVGGVFHGITSYDDWWKIYY